MAWYQHVTLWHDTNACHTIVLYARHIVAWYQYMLHHGVVPVYNVCYTMVWYQCMLHYGMLPMHVTIYHGTNACHTIA